MEVKGTIIFEKNWNCKSRIVINRGGASSSKTYSLIQLFILKMMTERNKRIIVVMESLSVAKAVVQRDLLDYIDSQNIEDQFVFTKAPPILTNKNTGSTLEIVGAYDNPGRFKGLSANYFWFEEGTSISRMFFDQAIIRMRRKAFDSNPNQFFISTNPTDPFSWVREIESRDDVTVITSNFEDNPFLSQEDINEIYRLKDTDYDMWLVYGQGEYTEVRGAIYKNWDVVDDWPEGFEEEKCLVGLDWGFSTDPSTAIKTYKKDDEVWVKEMFYETGMLNSDIMKRFELLNHSNTVEIIADSAEPKSIAELRNSGLFISAAKKGPDSIRKGIDTLKRLKIHIVAPSNNLKKEFINYKNKKNKDGSYINVPEDKWNHCLDALRYIALNKWGIINADEMFDIL